GGGLGGARAGRGDSQAVGARLVRVRRGDDDAVAARSRQRDGGVDVQAGSGAVVLLEDRLVVGVDDYEVRVELGRRELYDDRVAGRGIERDAVEVLAGGELGVAWPQASRPGGCQACQREEESRQGGACGASARD